MKHFEIKWSKRFSICSFKSEFVVEESNHCFYAIFDKYLGRWVVGRQGTKQRGKYTKLPRDQKVHQIAVIYSKLA
jgi:hypothetical protein